MGASAAQRDPGRARLDTRGRVGARSLAPGGVLRCADGLAAVPRGGRVAVVSDHADVSDFGVRGVPAFRPRPAVADVLQALRARAAARELRWSWLLLAAPVPRGHRVLELFDRDGDLVG